MTESCSFHQQSAAHFHCQHCDLYYCDQCITVREIEEYGGKQRYYFCPACNDETRILSVGNMIEPFWKRLPKIFLYPLQPVPMILTAVLSALGAMFPSILLVKLAVTVLMFQYAFTVFLETSQGSLKAPTFTWELINANLKPIIQQYFLIAGVVLASTMVLFHLGTFAGICFIALSALVFPVLIMVQMATNSILHAVNPMIFFPIIFRIGWPYLLMYLFLIFLYSAPMALLGLIPLDRFPAVLVLFFVYFFSQYYTLVSYHLMGYVLLQYHDEIGYPVDYDFFIANRGGKPKKVLNDKEQLENGVSVLIKMGKYQQAIDRLLPHIKGEHVDPELSDKFLKLLRMTNDEKRSNIYAPRHLNLLVAKGKKQKALELFDEINKNKEHLPEAKTVFTVAGWYNSRGEYKKAMEAYIYFINHFKKDAQCPEACFNLAQLLHEQGGNTSKARQILNAIVKHYPHHPVSTDASKYLAAAA